MVILLLAVLAAVAIPNFQDFRTDARNEAVKGGLGNMRAAIAIARATITLKEDSNVPIYPTAIELQINAYNGSHPILNALPLEKNASSIHWEVVIPHLPTSGHSLLFLLPCNPLSTIVGIPGLVLLGLTSHSF